jgi:hypothetical protein
MCAMGARLTGLMMKRIILGLSVVALAAGAAPASAATVLFGLTGSSSTSGTAGNVRTFTAGSGANAVSVSASAWSIAPSSTSNGGISTNNTLTDVVSKAYLGAYSTGLGVTNGTEGNGGSNNSHTNDNYAKQDFIVLQFNKKVRLISAKFTPFAVVPNSSVVDTDATVGVGSNNAAVNNALNITTRAQLNALVPTQYSSNSSATGANVRQLDPANLLSRIWIIAASLETSQQQALHDGGSAKADGFKLGDVLVSTVVPEPANWLMMIAGFGFIGAAMRSRKARVLQPA